MNKQGKLVGKLLAALLCLVLASASSGALAQPEFSSNPPPETYTNWLDDFYTVTLDSSWSWVREDPALWSLTDRSSFLRLMTHNGHLYEGANNMKNILLQPAPGENFMIETWVEFEPGVNFQAAGLIVYFDDLNNVSLKRAYCDAGNCVGNGIYFDKQQNGVLAQENFSTAVSAVKEAYLRIIRVDNQFAGYYSENGADWQLIGIHELVPTTDPLQLGLFAGQNWDNSVPQIPADFDYFRLLVPTFADVLPNHWAYLFVEAVQESGLSSGYPDSTFRPENQVTRAEMAVFLLNGMGITPPAMNGSHPFSDIAGHWAEAYIEELFDLGVTGGYPDGTYRPEAPVTRAEMAVFLLNGMGITPPGLDGSHPFSDIAGHWAEIFIEELSDQAVTGGYPDGTYRPENRVTRAEMAVFLVNAFSLGMP